MPEVVRNIRIVVEKISKEKKKTKIEMTAIIKNNHPLICQN